MLIHDKVDSAVWAIRFSRKNVLYISIKLYLDVSIVSIFKHRYSLPFNTSPSCLGFGCS